MKITKEQFNKLNQLDRIEFRQRKDWLDKTYDNNQGSFDFIWKIIYIIGFIILLAISMYPINPDSTDKILSTLPIILKLGFICFFILWFFELGITLKNKIETKKLEGEYFKIDIKTKK